MRDLSSVWVVLTREPADNAPLAAALRARGAEVVELPCVRTEPLGDDSALADALRSLTPDDLLVLTSRRGVDAVLRAVSAERIRAPIVAIGEATGHSLFGAGIRGQVARESTGAALARDLRLPRGRVLLARADRASHELPDALRARGAQVDEVVAYRTVPGATADEGVGPRLRSGGVGIVVFASPSAVDGFLQVASVNDLAGAGVVAIGPTTAARVTERAGIRPTVAGEPSAPALLRAIERCVEERYVARA